MSETPKIETAGPLPPWMRDEIKKQEGKYNHDRPFAPGPPPPGPDPNDPDYDGPETNDENNPPKKPYEEFEI